MLNKHKINGGFLAPDYIPFEERNKNEMLLELQNEIHTKDKEIERLHSIIKEVREYIEENANKEPWKSLNEKELLEILDKEGK